MNEDIKLSIIIPIYNGENYIQSTIHSVLNSSYQNLEILLIDDGSTDHSLELCQREADLDSRIKVYHKENEGILFFDRGIPDTLAYARLIGLTDRKEIELAVDKYRYNRQVFILPPWENIYHTDKERKQSFNEAIDTYYVMKDVYKDAGYTLIEVPKLPVTERRNFVISSINSF